MKVAIAFVLLAIGLVAFTIRDVPEQRHKVDQVGTVRWPFTICGDSGWRASTLFLSDIPAKNLSLDVFAVLAISTQIGKTMAERVEYDYAEFNASLNGVAIDYYTMMISKNCSQNVTVDIVDTIKIPEEAPSGNYQHMYTLRNTDDVPVGCFYYTFKL